MAKAVKTASKKSAKRAVAAKKAGKATKAPAKRVAATTSRKATKRTTGAGGQHDPVTGLESHITHTEFATPDPAALKAFTQKALGWSFGKPFHMDDAMGDYHLFAYGKTGGGGIMSTRPGEAPRVTPYIHTADVAKTLGKALKAGATHMMGPETIMPGVTLAVVMAPGGIMMGFSGPK